MMTGSNKRYYRSGYFGYVFIFLVSITLFMLLGLSLDIFLRKDGALLPHALLFKELEPPFHYFKPTGQPHPKLEKDRFHKGVDIRFHPLIPQYIRFGSDQ